MSKFDEITSTLLSDLLDTAHDVDGVRTDDSGYETRAYDLREITKRAITWLQASLARQDKLIESWVKGDDEDDEEEN